MREAYYGSHTHTLRSHGMTITRTHVHDWVVLIVLVIVAVILNVIHPFYRFVGKDMMSDLKYPLKDNTVPLWTIPVSDSFPSFYKKNKNSKMKEILYCD